MAALGRQETARRLVASGAYIIFMDADNCARPHMVADFVRGMQSSGADCLTCHFAGFSGDAAPSEHANPDFIFSPVGPAHRGGDAGERLW